MSFADFAASAGSATAASSRPAVDRVTLQLEQFQRQVAAVARSSTAAGALDEDVHDRLRFACLLQEEITATLAHAPPDAWPAPIKRKLCKDFEAISSLLEASVVRVAARAETQQQVRREQQDGYIMTGGEAPGDPRVQAAELETAIASNDALIAERAEDITKIHHSVAQVHEIFRDLAAIVHDQQTEIDGIDTAVQASLQQTQQGLEQVKKAAESQSYCVLQ